LEVLSLSLLFALMGTKDIQAIDFLTKALFGIGIVIVIVIGIALMLIGDTFGLFVESDTG